VRRLQDLAETFRCLAEQEAGEQVRWVELPARSGSRHVRLAAAPLSVSAKLDSTLFQAMRSVVITSATLSVGGAFDYLTGRLGVDRSPAERVRCLQVDSPFDYPRQAVLAVVRDGPLPTEPAFEDWLPGAVSALVGASRGGALVLFTAWGTMTRVFELVRDDLERLGLEALCQGQAPRDRLLQRFRQNPSSVLFGTDSFWQGVDVVGDALRLVIIGRLPFDVPSDPLFQARVEQIESGGVNAFSAFSLPRAVLRLKQGFGRLIRSRSDRGAVVLLDRRVADRSYGRRFLASLPPAAPLSGGLDEVCPVLARFLADSGSDTTERIVSVDEEWGTTEGDEWS
jgi:ATP-dependent DNA helicase DinG